MATNEWVAFVDLVSSPHGGPVPPHRQHVLAGQQDRADHLVRPGDGLSTGPTPASTGSACATWCWTRRCSTAGRAQRSRPLLDPASGLRVAYEDDDVTILESPTAQSKAFFTTSVREVSAETTLARLQTNPRAIDGPGHGRGRRRRRRARRPTAAERVPVPLAEYRPNDLRATFEAPGPGIFVVKDSYFPGWQATLNGRPAEMVRVNGAGTRRGRPGGRPLRGDDVVPPARVRQRGLDRGGDGGAPGGAAGLGPGARRPAARRPGGRSGRSDRCRG